jgi:hypothetical protein
MVGWKATLGKWDGNKLRKEGRTAEVPRGQKDLLLPQ